LYKWLTDGAYFKKYGLPAHNDLEFVEMVKSAFTGDFEQAEKLYSYVVDKMGGLDIDNFVMHVPCA
jgi:hypothetical protein